MVDRVRRLRPDDRLRVPGDRHVRRVQHRQVVGSVADRRDDATVRSVQATHRRDRIRLAARIDDVAVARLEFADGGIASLTSIWHDIIDRPSLRHVEIFSENLYLHLDGEPTSPLTWQFTGEPVQTLGGDALARACIDAGAARERDLAPVAGGAMFNPLTSFLDAIADGKDSPIPLREALAAHRIVDAIYASADDAGARVHLGR